MMPDASIHTGVDVVDNTTKRFRSEKIRRFVSWEPVDWVPYDNPSLGHQGRVHTTVRYLFGVKCVMFLLQMALYVII